MPNTIIAVAFQSKTYGREFQYLGLLKQFTHATRLRLPVNILSVDVYFSYNKLSYILLWEPAL